MNTPSGSGQGQRGTIKSLVEEALVLLKIAEEKIPMQKEELKPKATQAKQSVEGLLSALQNGENIAISIFDKEMEQLRDDVKRTDWTQYHPPR